MQRMTFSEDAFLVGFRTLMILKFVSLKVQRRAEKVWRSSRWRFGVNSDILRRVCHCTYGLSSLNYWISIFVRKAICLRWEPVGVKTK
jgi:hypothetical protein